MRKTKLRNNDDRVRDLRWRQGYLYGLTLDPEKLDDAELEQLDALGKRVIERTSSNSSASLNIEDAKRAHQARRYADDVEKLLDVQPANIQAGLREREAPVLEFVRATGKIPSNDEQQMLERGELRADSIGDTAAFELNHPPPLGEAE